MFFITKTVAGWWIVVVLLAGAPGCRLAAEELLWTTAYPEHDIDLTYPISYTLAYQLAGYVLISECHEDENFRSASWDNLTEAWEKGPKSDEDDWEWNYLAHPLWGSETYLRSRAQGLDCLEAFLFSAGASVVWEFGMESWSQRPSSQDLVITPAAGMILGELRFRVKRYLIEQEGVMSGILLVVLDPLQSLTEGIGGLFGQDWSEPAFRKGPPAGAQARQGSPLSVELTSVHQDLGVQVSWSWRW
jgi:hypothetical protein